MREGALRSAHGRAAQVGRIPIIAENPTIEEILVAQDAVLEVIGEKGREKRVYTKATR